MSWYTGTDNKVLDAVNQITDSQNTSSPSPPAPTTPVPGTPAPGGGTNAGQGPYSPNSIFVGADGGIYVWKESYDSATGTRSYGFVNMGSPTDGGFSWDAVAAASGLPVAVLQTQYTQSIRQTHQQGNAVLRNKNPDGTYSVTLPDGTIANKTLQDIASLPGISAGDVAQADKDFVYSEMRAKEANWTAGGVQLYNGGAGPGAQMPTMQPAVAQAAAAPAPMPTPGYTQPPAAGGTPTPAPAAGVATQGVATQGVATATPTAQTQGASMSTSMLPMQRATGAGGTSPGATSSGVGNYGNPNGSWQDYELGTRGLQDQYERGNYTYQMGTPTYGQNGETRQQFSQRVNDLQSQYNMSKATFDLSQQGQTQANQAQQTAVQANKNQQMGQGRTIYGGGLGSLGPMKISGIT